jgi:hypothetical protein
LWVEDVLPSQKKGNNFYQRFSCAMPKIVKHTQSCSNSRRWWQKFS